MADLVSVVVPVRDGLPHLPATVESIRAQTYPEVEIILSDGGSGPATRAYLSTLLAGDEDNRWRGRLRVVTAPASAGLADNWNHATAQARGAFIKLVCQDDLLAPDVLTRQVAALRAHPGAGIAACRRDVIDVAGRIVVRNRGCQGLPEGFVTGGRVLRECYRVGTTVIGEPFAVLFRAEALAAALPWRDERPYIIDLDLYGRALRQADVVIVPGSAGAFRVSPGALSTQLAGAQRRAVQDWQAEIVPWLDPPPGPVARRLAHWAVAGQAARRQVAYALLRLRPARSEGGR